MNTMILRNAVYVLMLFVCFPAYSALRDHYSEMDKHILSAYKATDFQKKDGQIPPIIPYIKSKINSSTNALEIENGFWMIMELQDPHREIMLDICKNYFLDHLSNNTLSYTEKDLLGTVKNAMYALGTIRKESVINFLLPFIKQPQFWKNENLLDIELKVKDEVSSDNYLYLTGEIRYTALSAIFQVGDALSKSKYDEINRIVNDLPDDDFQKKYLIERFEGWKKIHAGGGLKNVVY